MACQRRRHLRKCGYALEFAVDCPCEAAAFVRPRCTASPNVSAITLVLHPICFETFPSPGGRLFERGLQRPPGLVSLAFDPSKGGVRDGFLALAVEVSPN